MNPRRRVVFVVQRAPKGQPSKWNTIERTAKVLSAAAIPLAIALGGWLIQRQIQDQSVRRDYVQLAVTILADPDTTNNRLRRWAADVLASNSPIPIDADAVLAFSSAPHLLPTTICVAETKTFAPLDGRFCGGSFYVYSTYNYEEPPTCTITIGVRDKGIVDARAVISPTYYTIELVERPQYELWADAVRVRLDSISGDRRCFGTIEVLPT